ncbi:MAG: hypothetical protein QOE83_1955 [Actinomycetota bacterium]|jgi:hypothetical protein|nr:hypothetical protein [Actinomycetota bacterium]
MSRDERTFEARVSDPAIPPALAHGELELLGLLRDSSNYAFLARAKGEPEDVLAVYKPQRGETPLWDFPEGTLHQREAAAYVVSRELGWPNVPPTLVREGPHGVGSVQKFVEFDPAEHFFTMEVERAAEFRKVAVFDLIINNADRKGGHCLLDPQGTIWLIDHGVCFNEEPKLRTVIWTFVGEAIEPSLLADVDRFTAALAEGPLRDELSALLSPAELDTMGDRARAVIDAGTYPEPGPGRPFPWPPV